MSKVTFCRTLPAIFTIFLTLSPSLLAQKVYTVAGGFVGNGGPATSAGVGLAASRCFRRRRKPGFY